MEIKRCYDTIVGASVGENQLINATSLVSGTNNGITVTAYTTKGEITVSGTATANATIVVLDVLEVKNGHVYYLSQPQGASGSTFWLRTGENTFWNYKQIGKSTDATVTSNLRAYVASGQTVNFKIKPQFVDLTAELGSTIADYIYSLETATAGSGIAKLRSWGFLRGYQAFNAGSIESVEVTGKKVVGFNQFCKDASYLVSGSAYRFCDIPFGENHRLYASFTDKDTSIDISGCDFGVSYSYNPNNNSAFKWLIQNGVVINHTNESNSGTLPIGTLCGYIFVYPNDQSTWDKLNQRYDICVNIYNEDRNGEYEAYTEQTYDYGDDTLNGIFKLDANNNLYADGDVKTSDGTITRKYTLIDFGAINWTYSGTTGEEYFYGHLSASAKAKVGGLNNAITSQYAQAGYDAVNGNNGTFGINNLGTIVKVCDTNYTDATAFKQMLTDKNVKMVYELATPTTEQGDPFLSPQVCYPDGTEEYVTSNGVPVGHETRYEL